jgi:hypothetical protein
MPNYGHALYYPYIHIKDERWIKMAALYYEGLSRIVPAGLQPADSNIVRALNDEFGFISNLNPAPDADTTEDEFLSFVVKYLQDDKLRVYLNTQLKKLVKEKPEIEIHDSKLSHILKIRLHELGLARHPDVYRGERSKYYRFEPVAGAMYMTCLANRMASDRALPLVSDHPEYQRIIRGVQDGTSLYEENPDKGYLVASAVIESAIPDNLDSITVKQIIKFRKGHADERHRFYNAVDALAGSIPTIKDPDSFQACLNSHVKTIQQAVEDLRFSLVKLGIACTTGFLGLSVPAWATTMGQSMPHFGVQVATGGILTMACGLMTKEGINYYEAKRKSPYSYIYSIKKQLRQGFFENLNEGLRFL